MVMRAKYSGQALGLLGSNSSSTKYKTSWFLIKPFWMIASGNKRQE